MFLVLTMIVLVAAFNIVSSLVMLVRTKTADIAILRTMGATRGAILRLFLLDGLAIGGVGDDPSASRWAWLSRSISRRSANGCSTPSASCCSTRRSTCWPRCRRTSPGRRSRPSPAWRWSSRSWPRSIRRARAARLDPVEGLHRE